MAVISETQVIARQRRIRSQAARRGRAKVYDTIARGVIGTIAGFIALVLVYIVFYVVSRGLPYVHTLSFFTSGNPDVGIGPQIFNTFYMLILSLIIMIPIGVGSAVYMVEYARQGRFVSVLRFATETLTSTPSIVVGLFGALLFADSAPFLQIGPIQLSGLHMTLSRLAGALTLAVLNVPWMLRTAEDAIRAVPNEYREASLAMGATRFQTIRRVMLPSALPGIVTGILIVAGRVTGESAALLFTGGEGGAPTGWFSLNPFLSGDTLAVHAYTLFAENPGPNAAALRLGTSLVLVVLVLLFNVSARLVSNVISRRSGGKTA